MNLKIKYRESFRPFAPAVKAERVSDWFEIERPSPYMLLVTKVKKPDQIPAVTHVDGTARVQVVRKDCKSVTLCYKQKPVTSDLYVKVVVVRSKRGGDDDFRVAHRLEYASPEAKNCRLTS